MGLWIAIGLILGVAAGLLFGDYCTIFQVPGEAYVQLLQMTVLPYLTLTLVAKLGQVNPAKARRLGLCAIIVTLALWVIGILLVVLIPNILPPTSGAYFYSENLPEADAGNNLLLSFIPANFFKSLAEGNVPAVVVFCLFFGCAMAAVPGSEPVLKFFEQCAAAFVQINLFLAKLAPFGLFALTAAAAGTLRIEELSKLQAYLIMFAIICAVAAFCILPLLISGLTGLRYRDVMRASQEPMLLAFATGKLLIVLPQIMTKCEALLVEHEGATDAGDDMSVGIVTPLAYSFPHVGKILPLVFIPFAAWYTGSSLSIADTLATAVMGTASSFGSPLVTIPYLLDQNRLPQDLLAFFILPGFITTRLADVVGVMHLMAFTLIVISAQRRRLKMQWRLLATAVVTTVICLAVTGIVSRWYLKSTAIEYDLDDRLLSLEVQDPHEKVEVARSRVETQPKPLSYETTLERVRETRTLRVGYHADHLPYCYFNHNGHLAGLDVELMHRLAASLDVQLEFVPYKYDTVVEQLNSGEIDLATGGLMMTTERLLHAGFTAPYQTATIGIVVKDHRRRTVARWDTPGNFQGMRLGVAHSDVAAAARRHLPEANVILVDSVRSSFEATDNRLDGFLMSAEEGAAWTVLHPDYTVVVPEPALKRPVGLAVRLSDTAWLQFLNRWLDFERMDGSLDRLRAYWVHGHGIKQRTRRWCLLRNTFHWLP